MTCRDFGITPAFDVCKFEVAPFAAFSNGLANMSCTTNGAMIDEPEDVWNGLKLSAEMPWSGLSRNIIHFADAPCHGSKYHDPIHRLKDNEPHWPEGEHPPETAVLPYGTMLSNLRDNNKVIITLVMCLVLPFALLCDVTSPLHCPTNRSAFISSCTSMTRPRR